MDKQCEAFIYSERGCELHSKINTFAREVWQAAITHKQTKINRLESIIKDQRLLFDAREARLEKFIREFKENT
jgi:uncharacterized protein involved in propanediol utilization